MNITFTCPRCQQDGRLDVAEEQAAIACPHCQVEMTIPAAARSTTGVHQCLVCASRDLFVRKDFPQRLGVGIVVVGFVASSIAWAQYMTIATFAILFATAFIDVVLYLVMGEALVCYRCGAQYRLAPGLDKHTGFNLETHERYRQQAARLAEHGAVKG